MVKVGGGGADIPGSRGERIWPTRKGNRQGTKDIKGRQRQFEPRMNTEEHGSDKAAETVGEGKARSAIVGPRLFLLAV